MKHALKGPIDQALPEVSALLASELARQRGEAYEQQARHTLALISLPHPLDPPHPRDRDSINETNAMQAILQDPVSKMTDVQHMSRGAHEAAQALQKAMVQHSTCGKRHLQARAQRAAACLTHTGRVLHMVANALAQIRIARLNESLWRFDHAHVSYDQGIAALSPIFGCPVSQPDAGAAHARKRPAQEHVLARQVMSQLQAGKRELFAREHEFRQHNRDVCKDEQDAWSSRVDAGIAALHACPDAALLLGAPTLQFQEDSRCGTASSHSHTRPHTREREQERLQERERARADSAAADSERGRESKPCTPLTTPSSSDDVPVRASDAPVLKRASTCIADFLLASEVGHFGRRLVFRNSWCSAPDQDKISDPSDGASAGVGGMLSMQQLGGGAAQQDESPGATDSQQDLSGGSQLLPGDDFGGGSGGGAQLGVEERRLTAAERRRRQSCRTGSGRREVLWRDGAGELRGMCASSSSPEVDDVYGVAHACIIARHVRVFVAPWGR